MNKKKHTLELKRQVAIIWVSEMGNLWSVAARASSQWRCGMCGRQG